METAREIIGLWPSPRALAEDIGQGVDGVYKWHQRGRIPAVHDAAIVEAARRRGIALDFERLARARAANLAGAPDPGASQAGSS